MSVGYHDLRQARHTFMDHRYSPACLTRQQPAKRRRLSKAWSSAAGDKHCCFASTPVSPIDCASCFSYCTPVCFSDLVLLMRHDMLLGTCRNSGRDFDARAREERRFGSAAGCFRREHPGATLGRNCCRTGQVRVWATAFATSYSTKPVFRLQLTQRAHVRSACSWKCCAVLPGANMSTVVAVQGFAACFASGAAVWLDCHHVS